MDYEIVIGLEIHLELKTKSKFFCDCPNQEAEKPNINICPICLGHPGILPVINKEAVIKGLKLGLALKGEIAEDCHFDRKNYFYPDLPKGYQISQYQSPLINGGVVEFEYSSIERQVYPVKSRKAGTQHSNALSAELFNRVNLERIHLEEDTAKVFHVRDSSLLDFNRAGVPLLEIVTKPEITSPSQAKVFLEELLKIIRYLGISDADMEKGQLRCDANISIRPKGDKKYYSKTEIKNLNSFRAVERALCYEFDRQVGLWEQNNPPKYQTTRGWDGIKTIEQRGKEEEQDYRYFPEPDLPPLNKNSFKEQGIDLDFLKNTLPELPFSRQKRFKEEYGFDHSQSCLLTDDKESADYTEKVVSELKVWLLSLEAVEGSEQEIWENNKKQFVKLLSNWLINHLLVLQKKLLEKEFRITPENFAEFLIMVYEKKISGNVAQKVLEKMFETGKDVDRILSEHEFKTTEKKDELDKIIREVVKDNPEITEKIKQGKTNVIQYLVGQAMKKTRGRAEPNTIRKLLEEELKN